MEYLLHPDLYIKETAAKGRGVFCRSSIPANTVIEVSPVVSIDVEGRDHLRKTLLREYIFGWQAGGCCVALGYLSIYNHSYAANCIYVKHPERGVISISTVRDISAGEELCTNYNGACDDPAPVTWFEVHS